MMRKFSLRILTFLLPILIVSVTFEVLLRNIPNDYAYKREYLDNNADEIETLILGSSHTFYGLNPQYFTDKTFNLAQVSQPLLYDFNILKKYQNKFGKLKTIILPISYFTLFYDFENSVESWRTKNYTIYFQLSSSKSYFDYSEVLSNNLSVILKRTFRNYLKEDKNVLCSELGWGNSYKSINSVDLMKSGLIAANRHTKINNDSVDVKTTFHENVVLLNSIINWSKERDVQVLLFTPPAFHSYNKNLNKDQLNLTLNTTHDFSVKYSNCNYYNMLNDSSFISNDFYDADHLSEIGAEKLSRIMDEKLKQIIK